VFLPNAALVSAGSDTVSSSGTITTYPFGNWWSCRRLHAARPSTRTQKQVRTVVQKADGRAVDAIVNSLVVELLDGTIMGVKIGKSDIMDYNNLATELFDCSFRAVGSSYIS
jgi:hypothetical protein